MFHKLLWLRVKIHFSTFSTEFVDSETLAKNVNVDINYFDGEDFNLMDIIEEEEQNGVECAWDNPMEQREDDYSWLVKNGFGGESQLLEVS